MKLDIIFHYDVDTTTGNITYIGKEEITVDTIKKTSTTSKKIDSNTEPLVTLETNKLVLTQGAVDILDVCSDCRIDVKYKQKGGITLPIIGTDQAFNSKSGNKLTKSNTVSFRGAANEKLAAYGTIFKLEPSEDKGIYYMIGNKEIQETKIPDEIIDIENELDMISLDDLSNSFDFTL